MEFSSFIIEPVNTGKNRNVPLGKDFFCVKEKNMIFFTGSGRGAELLDSPVITIAL